MRDTYIRRDRDRDGTVHLVVTGGWDAVAMCHPSSPDPLARSAPESVAVMAGVRGA